MKNAKITKIIKKWGNDSFKPYKYQSQKEKDITQVVDGIVNLVVGVFKLVGTILNLLIIFPIKSMLLDFKGFFTKYNELSKEDKNALIPTFRLALTGLFQVLTSPLMPFRIIFRMIATPKDGVSVFENAGLKKLVDEWLKNNQEPSSQGVTIASTSTLNNELPKELQLKIDKYITNNQKDAVALKELVKKPTLTYFKMKELKERIDSVVQTPAPSMKPV